MTDQNDDPAVRDLDAANAQRAAARVAQDKAWNIALAKRNPKRRAEMLAAGILTEGDLTNG